MKRIMAILAVEYNISPSELEDMTVSRLIQWILMIGDYNKERASR